MHNVILLYIQMRREFDAKIRKGGNSHVITIPAETFERFKLKVGEFLTVSIEIEDNKK